jgi:putative transposase
VKKSTKSARRHQPRKRRSQRKSKSPVQGLLHFRGQVREALLCAIQGAVVSTAEQLVEDEVTELVGAPWSRKGESPLRRGGRTKTRAFLDGEPVHIIRPRVRDQVEGCEVPLKTVAALTDRDALDGDVMRHLVHGISTRKYDAALTSLSDGLGLKKSAVSSAFQRASQKDLDALNGRALAGSTYVAVYIDGVGFANHTCVVAMGITIDGQKRILGLREGATENAVLVGDLLDELVERGLEICPRTLFVLDGSKALRRGVENVFGKRAVVQRCIIHKERNVLSYLPPELHADARRRLRAAWGMQGHDDALKALRTVLAWLKKLNESAAASLKEGFEETLTVHRLGVTGTLRRTLVTTNPIESAFDTVKRHAHRVKRWNGASMVMRWAGTGLVVAEQQFRRVKGHAALPQLIEALANSSLNSTKKTA